MAIYSCFVVARNAAISKSSVKQYSQSLRVSKYLKKKVLFVHVRTKLDFLLFRLVFNVKISGSVSLIIYSMFVE